MGNASRKNRGPMTESRLKLKSLQRSGGSAEPNSARAQECKRVNHTQSYSHVHGPQRLQADEQARRYLADEIRSKTPGAP
jgi:hypothetical protein